MQERSAALDESNPSNRYWVSIPGSTEPPAGPLTRADVLAAWRDGLYPDDTSICRSDQAEWCPISSLGQKPGRKSKARQIDDEPEAEEGDRESVEDDYSNLTAVSSGTSSAGSMLKVLAGIVALVGVAGGGKLGSTWGAALAVAGLIVAVLLYGTGVLLGALGESMLALKDVAVSTRLVAERQK